MLSQILDYVDIDDFEVPADWIPLTADMFHQWNGAGDDAQIVNPNAGAELNLGRSLSGGGVVAGFSSVGYNLFADVSQYDKLIIRGTGDRLRILANRLEDHGDFKEISVGLNEWDAHWDADMQTIVLPLSELRDCNTKREGTVRHDAFTHINAIKVESGSAVVRGIWLTHNQPTEITANSLIPSGDSRFYNLNGQVVDHPRKGIYIKNGRKIVVP